MPRLSHARLPASREFSTVAAAMAEFLRAGRNEEIIEGVLGRTGAVNVVFDALEHDGRRCETFAEAFAACCGGRTVVGQSRSVVDGRERITRTSRVVGRSWDTFNLEALRGLCAEFRGLDLPSEVYEAQAERAAAAWEDGLAALGGYQDEAQRAYYESVEADTGGPEIPAWTCEALAAALTDEPEQVDESMIEVEMIDWQPLAVRPAPVLRSVPLDATDAEVEAMFGIEIEPARVRPPALPAYAWR